MSITQRNTYVVGSNNDLSNALLNIDLNRIGGDLTYLENDGGTLKVSVGSLIEANGSIYAVSGNAETPSGTAEDGAYLFFDPAGPSFVWSTTAGTYDPELGGIYDASDRRQCRFRLSSATTWDVLLVPESPDVRINGDLKLEGKLEGGVSNILEVEGSLSVSGIVETQILETDDTIIAGDEVESRAFTDATYEAGSERTLLIVTSFDNEYVAGILCVDCSIGSYLVFYAYRDETRHLATINSSGADLSLSDTDSSLRIFWDGTALKVKNGTANSMTVTIGRFTNSLIQSSL